MRHFLKLLVLLALVTAPQTAGGQDIRIDPVPPGSKPKWTKVPRHAPGLLGPQPPMTFSATAANTIFSGETTFTGALPRKAPGRRW